MIKKNIYYIKLIILFIFLLLIFLWSINSGEIKIKDIFINNTLSKEDLFILFELRLPRIFLGLIVGIILSITGLVLQSLFRNPLVDPYIIGVSGGGALGAGIAILFNLQFDFLGINSLTIISFVTALITMLIVYRLGTMGKIIYIDRLLLSGVAISAMTSAILSLILVIKGKGMETVVYWIMGSLSGREWQEVKMSIPLSVIGIILIIINLKNLNIFQLGEETALHLGVNVQKLKITIIIASTLLAATSVSVSGIIGFIGLIVPHISRLLIGDCDIRMVFPITILLGGSILVAADTISRIILPDQQIPVGIFTSIIGVPFFLFMLIKK